MKILYCINAIYNSGGMERVLMNKTNYLVDKGYDVIVVTTEQKGRTPFFNFSSKVKLIDLGINYDDDLSLCLPLRQLMKKVKSFKHKKRLSQVLYAEKPDICISMFDRDFSLLPQIHDGSKKILEFHFSKQSKLIETRNPILRLLQRIRIQSWVRIINQYQRFVVLTEEDKEDWHGVHSIQVIPNSITGIPGSVADYTAKCICAVGRMTYQKGFDLLIQAWKICSARYPDWQLKIIGGGDKSRLEQMIRSMQLQNHVQLLPSTNHIAKEYLSSSIYVMSSRYEGLPMVLLEALSYGLPVVSFACPCGPRDIIEDEFGSLVECNDIKGLADALAEWMSDEQRRKQASVYARQKVSLFQEEAIMLKWEALFHNL